MIDIFEYKGEDFQAIFQSDGWKIGLLRYSERFARCEMLERHLFSDEVFVLLEGNAILHVSDGETKEYIMEKNKVYNIHKAVWHHITVSENATVLVVENSNTCKENTERIQYSADKRIY